MEDGLWIILLEAGAALGVLALIVWSCWPKARLAVPTGKLDRSDRNEPR
jgi:hypothetical protein